MENEEDYYIKQYELIYSDNSKIPSWLPDIVKESLFDRIVSGKDMSLAMKEQYETLKNNPCDPNDSEGLKEMVDNFTESILYNSKRIPEYVIFVLPAFIDSNMKYTWSNLQKNGEEFLVGFIAELLIIENMDYGMMIKWDNHYAFMDNEVKKIEKTLVKLKNQINNLQKYKGDFEEVNDKFLALEEVITEVAEYYNNSNTEPPIFPASREMQSKSGMAIYFIRCLHLYCQKYNKNCYNEIADIVNAIFNTTYTYNNVAKLISK